MQRFEVRSLSVTSRSQNCITIAVVFFLSVLAMSLQLSTADIEPEDVTEAELQGIAELRARILKAQGRDVPLPEQV